MYSISSSISTCTHKHWDTHTRNIKRSKCMQIKQMRWAKQLSEYKIKLNKIRFYATKKIDKELWCNSYCGHTHVTTAHTQIHRIRWNVCCSHFFSLFIFEWNCHGDHNTESQLFIFVSPRYLLNGTEKKNNRNKLLV